MVNYKDLGLVNTREMFAKAIKGGYAIPAFNFNNMEQLQAIIQAAAETKSPVILQPLNMLRNSDGSIRRLSSTSTTAILSSSASRALTSVSLQ